MDSRPTPRPLPTTSSGFPLRSDVKEVRLALVLVGGVSLAIYMHGITLELHKLVRASHALEAYLAEHPHALEGAVDGLTVTRSEAVYPGKWDTEDVYIEALMRLTSRERLRLAIVVDVIGGTSAGGINGVVLGSALAYNRHQDDLKKLWINEGGIGSLVREPRAEDRGLLSSITSHFQDGFLPSFTSLLGSALKVVANPTKGLLSGSNFSVKLHRAFKAVEESTETRAPSSLVPDDESLELLATTTSVRGIDSPIFALERTDIKGLSYRQVMRFEHSQERRHFAKEFTGALAFAARVTSSFPGAFPPNSLKRFSEETNASLSASGEILDFGTAAALPPFEFGQNPPSLTDWYMDGGVCDNYPFDIVIDAIRKKPASRQVSRELIYLEPDPRAEHEPQIDQSQAPTIVESVRMANSTIRAHVDLQYALADLEEINDRIAQVGKTAEQLMTTLDEESPHAATEPNAQDHAGRVYRDLRLIEEGKRFGEIIVEHLRLRRKSTAAVAIIRAFTDVEMLMEHLGANPQPQLAYELRHAEFALQGLNDALSSSTITVQATREILVDTKKACWDWKQQLGDAARVVVRRLPPTVLQSEESISNAAPQLWAIYTTQLRLPVVVDPPQLAGEETADLRQRLHARFARFAEWDFVLLPLLALARIPALKPIHLRRFSPLDTSLLFEPKDRAVDEHRSGILEKDDKGKVVKVKGVGIFHFGAFFKREWRENDYLVGRLDGVELILRLLSEQANRNAPPQPEKTDHESDDQHLQRRLAFEAFDKILIAEGDGDDRLNKDLLAQVRTRVQLKKKEYRL